MNLNFTGKMIAKLRKSVGFTQASLAKKLGVSDKQFQSGNEELHVQM